MHKCVFCGGDVEKKLVTFTQDDGEKYLIVEHVPAEVCNRCGEKSYSPEVTDALLKIGKNRTKPIKTVEVPIFDFAAH
jgi:HTH-type transcriptional regulator/antitoxin MqsA